MADCIVRSRIDPHIKLKAAKIFGYMKLTLSEAIRLFLYQSMAKKCIPFSINMSNATSRTALHAARQK